MRESVSASASLGLAEYEGYRMERKAILPAVRPASGFERVQAGKYAVYAQLLRGGALRAYTQGPCQQTCGIRKKDQTMFR